MFDVVDGARRILAARRRRKRFLPPDVLGEPAWDILLDLLISQAEGRDVSLKSACIASGVPSSTAMRRLEALRRRGLVDHRPDPKDGRRTLLILTELGDISVSAAVRDAFLHTRIPVTPLDEGVPFGRR